MINKKIILFKQMKLIKRMSIVGFGRMIHTLCSAFSVSVSVFATRFGCHHKIRNCNNVYALGQTTPEKEVFNLRKFLPG